MEYRLPQGRNLLDKLDLEGDGPCMATHLEPVDGVVLGDGGSEVAFENHRHRLPYHLHEAYAAVFTSPFQDQYHHLSGRLLHKFSFTECRLDQLHHHLPFRLLPALLPSLSPSLDSYLHPP